MTTQYKTVEIQLPPLYNIYIFYSTFLKKFLARWNKMGPLCSHSNQQVTLNSMISIELIKNKCSDSHVCLGLFDDVPNFNFIHFILIRHLFKSVCKFVTWLLCT